MDDASNGQMGHSRHYPGLRLDQIPRLQHDDPLVDDLISQNKPVVVMSSGLVASAKKWNLDYLEQNIGDAKFTVFQSRSHKFKYYDDKKVAAKNHEGKFINQGFVPPISRTDMTMTEFKEHLSTWKKGQERVYLQHALTNNIGLEVTNDFLRFNWKYCLNKQSKHNWGPLTSNLLLIGMEGNVTPCHYDEQHNLFAQVHGYKRCILFSPEMFECLYPHPVHHPHDRQSMVDFERPDYTRFPKFRDAKGVETILEPGDVLYIPIYWWHHIESHQDAGITVTINFWYRGRTNAKITYPLQPHQKISVMRNIEKMLLECLQDPDEMAPLLRSIVEGRFTN